MKRSDYRFTWLQLLVILLVTLPVTGYGQQGSAATATTTEPASEVPDSLRNARATMRTFLHSMNDIKRGQEERIDDALRTLDLSEVNPLIAREYGRDLAWNLLEVLDRTRLVDIGSIPEQNPDGYYLFERYPDRDGTLIGDVRITRQADGSWLFDRISLNRLEPILASLSDRRRVKAAIDQAEHEEARPLHLRIRDQLPESLKTQGWILEPWQWLGLLLVTLISIVVDRLLSLLLALMMRLWLTHHTGDHYRSLSTETLRPFGLMAMAAIWWGGLNLLALPQEALLVLLLAAKFVASIAGVWAAYRLVDLLDAYLMEKASRTATTVDDMLVPLVKRTAKLFVTVLGVVFLADNMNVDITGLLAGLGLGGLAFALAAKDAVENFFGSLMVLMDRTFVVGDWIVVDDIEGTVESIGFRSTRIRTFYNSVITMPNSRLITAAVDNMGRRRYRRLKTILSLTYDTPPERIEAFCNGLRQLVLDHPQTRKDYFHIYFNEFSAASLDILVYVFFASPDWGSELEQRHRFLLDVLRLADQVEIEFAFPTQTLYLRGEARSGDQGWPGVPAGRRPG